MKYKNTYLVNFRHKFSLKNLKYRTITHNSIFPYSFLMPIASTKSIQHTYAIPEIMSQRDGLPDKVKILMIKSHKLTGMLVN